MFHRHHQYTLSLVPLYSCNYRRPCLCACKTQESLQRAAKCIISGLMRSRVYGVNCVNVDKPRLRGERVCRISVGVPGVSVYCSMLKHKEAEFAIGSYLHLPFTNSSTDPRFASHTSPDKYALFSSMGKFPRFLFFSSTAVWGSLAGISA